MVASLKSLMLALNSTGMSHATCSLLSKAMQRHALRRRKQMMISKKKQTLREGSRKPMSPIKRRIKRLQRLLPNGESMGLEGLFREAGDYIMCLQMQVRVMQFMVSVLSPMDSGGD